MSDAMQADDVGEAPAGDLSCAYLPYSLMFPIFFAISVAQLIIVVAYVEYK